MKLPFIAGSFLVAMLIAPLSASAQFGYHSPYPSARSSYSYAPSTAPYYHPGAQRYPYGGGLYGTYGGYQRLAIAPSGGAYANPPYLYYSPGAAPLLSMDGGTYSLGAQRRLQSLIPRAAPLPRGEIKIIHEKDASSNVGYSLNDAEFTIKPGEEQAFADDRNWIITIKGDGDQKDRRYTLKAGIYQFVADEKGWNVKEVVRRPTPENEDSKPSTEKP